VNFNRSLIQRELGRFFRVAQEFIRKTGKQAMMPQGAIDEE
jgi:hypothetical protein